jgi:hypothetical protein
VFQAVSLSTLLQKGFVPGSLGRRYKKRSGRRMDIGDLIGLLVDPIDGLPDRCRLVQQGNDFCNATARCGA